MAAKRTPLDLEIVRIIERDGPLNFKDFMETALYHTVHGYYNTARVRIGPSGDYYTSSNVHQAFGAVLATAFVDLWLKESGGEIPLTLLEVGAGTGQLALDILNSFQVEHSDVFAELHYQIVEKSGIPRRAQQELLQDFAGRVDWLPPDWFSTPEAAGSLNGIVFSNELVDAMPVHLVRIAAAGIQEAFITVQPEKASNSDGEIFALRWGPASKAVEDYVAAIGVELLGGQLIEVNLEAVDWLSQVSRSIKTGLVVTIDYGDLEGHLYGRDRIEGTLRSFSKHRIAASLLDRAGEQDITSSVNFSALIENGKRFGLETVSFERQSSFLVRHGLIDRIAQISLSGAFDPKRMNERLAIKNLLVEGGSSDNFRVLVQRKVGRSE